MELGIVDRASDSTIGRTLKKTFSSRIADSAGSSRRRPTSAFVAAMEDVLAVYTRPYDPDRPLVCVGRDLKDAHRPLITGFRLSLAGADARLARPE